jgi:hypothetical protein
VRPESSHRLFFPPQRLSGGWFHQLFSLTQHAGLAEKVRDHRLNTRTVQLNPVFHCPTKIEANQIHVGLPKLI